jgi:hypothetical protein
MKFLVQKAGICLCLLLPLCCPAQDRSSYDPMARQGPKKQQSLTDFALKQVNTCDKDYGQQIEDFRKIAVEESVGNISFWTTSIALFGLLSCFAIILHQSKESRRREAIAADLLTSVHNAWVEARERLVLLTTDYNALIESRNRTEESGPRLRAQMPEYISNTGLPAQSSEPLMAPILHRSPGRRGALPTGNTAANTGAQSTDQKPTANGETPLRDIDPAAQVSTLRQQLSASREREKHLEQQLNRSQRLLQAEQQRNNTLKRP